VEVPFEEVALETEADPQSRMEVHLGRGLAIEWALEWQQASEEVAKATETAKAKPVELAKA
jgi:hypothetical protein